jgi:hypothetical protein
MAGASRFAARTLVSLGWLVTAPLYPAYAQDRPEGVLHPIRERISYQAPLVTDVRRSAAPQTQLLQLWRDLEGRPETFSIGVLDGSPNEVFGAITDVAVGPDGTLLVLDASSSNVRVFDRRGQHLQTFGREGRGPGELTNPRAMALDPLTGDVFVVDAVRSVSLFRQVGNQFQFVDVWQMAASPNDMCSLGTSIVANVVPTNPAPISIFDRTGASLNSAVAPPYRSSMPSIQREANRGVIACRSGAYFAYASLLLGDVRLYDRSGTIRWIARLTDYRPMELIEMSNGGMMARTLPTGTHGFLGATFIGSRAILVQVGRQTVASHEQALPYLSIDSYLIDVNTGQGGLLSDRLSRIAAVGPDYWVEVRDVPFPRVIMHGDPGGFR